MENIWYMYFYMKEVLEKNELSNELSKPAKVGEIVEGKIIGKGKSAVFLDLGAVGTGIIYGKEFFETKDKIKKLKTGDPLFAKIIDLENEEGYIELSVSQAGKELTLAEIFQKKEKGEILTVEIKGANKGGLIAEVSGVPAFLPLSQLSPEHYPRVKTFHSPSGKGEVDTQEILKELQKFIGKSFEVKIFDITSHQNLVGGQIILSEKAKGLDKIKEVLKNYKVGDLVEGEITGITDFGAFMKFPSLTKDADSEVKESEGTFPEQLEGLIHISELDWKIIEDPAEIVKVGEKVKAKIIEIKDDRVSLSLKALKKDPWIGIEKKYKKGDTVSGQVTKFNPFGAFIQITSEIQGLCHISEFGTRTKMEEKLKIGKKYDFQILEIKPEEHRMSLKLVDEAKPHLLERSEGREMNGVQRTPPRPTS